MRLSDPTSSSVVESYSADRVLARQSRTLDSDTSAYLHAYPNDNTWPSSCAWTNDDDVETFWAADFANGEEDVRNVEVRLMEGEQDRMQGASVYLTRGTEETLCGTIDLATARPSANEPQTVSVACNRRNATGEGVKIVGSGLGVVVCDVIVYKGDQFPTSLE